MEEKISAVENLFVAMMLIGFDMCLSFHGVLWGIGLALLIVGGIGINLSVYVEERVRKDDMDR